jgi:hypothetical protein
MSMTARPAARDWLAGLVVGLLAGFLLAAWPTIGVLVAFVFAAPPAVSSSRPAGLGGLLVGVPTSWLAVIALAAGRCAEFNAAPGRECMAPDLSPWMSIATGLLVIGVSMSVRVARRAPAGAGS